MVSGGTEGGSVVANRVKNGDYEEYTAHDVSELSDFITALISIPVTKSTVQQLDFSRTESESSINVTCVLLFRRMNMTLITFSMKPISFFKILWIEI